MARPEARLLRAFVVIAADDYDHPFIEESTNFASAETVSKGEKSSLCARGLRDNSFLRTDRWLVSEGRFNHSVAKQNFFS